MAGSPAIETDLLSRRYSDTVAVDEVSIAVAEGTIFGYLGRNGSGKSTTVRMLTTLLRPSSGGARVGGHDILTEGLQVRACIGVTMQDAALDLQMTADEHLVFIARMTGFSNGDAHS